MGRDVRARRGRAAWVRRLIVAASPAAALALILVLLAAADRDGVTRAAARTRHVGAGAAAARVAAGRPSLRQLKLPRAQVSIAPQLSAVSVPRSFFGLSAEYWALPRYEQRLSTFEKVLSLVHVPGDGPLILRIGGDSADHVYWDATTRTMPPRAFSLSAGWLQKARTLVHRMSLRLILDLNLVADSPPMAAQWVRAALEDLPHGSIVGLEIGNEPDLYHRQPWYRLVRISRAIPHDSVLSSGYSAGTYVRNFRSYARALEQIRPRVPLLGPAVANPARDMKWLSDLIAGERRSLGLVSAHRYPLSECSQRSSDRYPTIARLLSESASAGMARSVSAAVLLAHRVGLRFRLTEVNSVTCGGRRGVSDMFATALWAPDALFELLRVGVDGVNVHIRPDAFNAPFILSANGLSARPLLYGLILFARALGPDARLVPAQLHAKRSLHLKIWAVRVRGDRLHVLAIDKGRRSILVELRFPGAGQASVQRLLAPSAKALSGVTLDGQRLSRQGSWQGRRVVQTLTPVAHRYELSMPGHSAALLSVRLSRVL
jgi:hypothetical protein